MESSSDRDWQDFHPLVREWFESQLGEPTRAQRLAWPKISAGLNTLLLAPTGSGKTLAAFLVAINRLLFSQDPRYDRGDSVSVLYISPLKALGVDVARNLSRPLAEITELANRRKVACRDVTTAIRSGDTTARERAQIARRPPNILITTPESLYLMLTSKAAEVLQQVETVIVDEIHSVVPTKRGTHLFLCLERLERLRKQACPEIANLQRIGLSATQRPLEEVARLLGGGEVVSDDDSVRVDGLSEAPQSVSRPRPVEIIEAAVRRDLTLTVDVPVEDMAHLAAVESDSKSSSREGEQAGGGIPSIWPAIHPRLLELIRAHRSTMVFVNSRRLAERLAFSINELAGEEIMLAHHGSLSKDARKLIEERLKEGLLPAIAATSSLELGIDMGAVDLVIQIEAPPSIASGLQRVGRAGHHVGGESKGVIIPKYRGDLVACAAAVGRMLKGQVEETFYPRNALDVLAQQIVAMVSMEPLHVEELLDLIRQAAPYHELTRGVLESVLDLLSGKFPSDQFSELRARINWNRRDDLLTPRRSAQRLAVLNAGTIPDRGLYGVFLAESETGKGRRVGELDEEMVFETRPGDLFLLGASTWRVVEINSDRVLVVPAPGEQGRMPFWHGEGVGRPAEFGEAVGEFCRNVVELPESEAATMLQTEHALDSRAAKNLIEYLQRQVEVTERVPSDQTIVIECFRDEIGDWRVAILSSFGTRIHAPWATAVAARLKQAGYEKVDMVTSDDGIMFRLADSDPLPSQALFFPASDEVEQEVIDHLGQTALFATRFRENAARALLLPRHQPGRRTPLWLQRKRSQELLQVASQFPRFPLILETYRECLRDVFDLPGLKRLLQKVESRQIECRMLTTTSASPFASSLLFNYVGNFIYDGDAPLAEQKVARLALDQSQLQELLGEADVRSLLEPAVIESVGLELQRLNSEYALLDFDSLHDLLIDLGELSNAEIVARVTNDEQQSELVNSLLEKLKKQERALEVRVGNEMKWIAVEDAVRYRDSLGCPLPDWIPDSLLQPIERPWLDLVSRFGRTHLPFKLPDIANRFGVGIAMVEGAAEQLVEEGRWAKGAFLPDGAGEEWCDREVLRRLKRRSMAKLREEVKPVPASTLIRFLPDWQGITRPRRGLDGILDVLEQLQGIPLPFSEWEDRIFPVRVESFSPHQLDELLAAGEIVWRGFSAIGEQDGRVAFYFTDAYPELAPAPEPPVDDSERRIQELLKRVGATFFDDLTQQTNEFAPDLLKSLWALVWSGHVSNDSLSPLRSRRQSKAQRGTSRGGRSIAGLSREGRPLREATRGIPMGQQGFRSRRSAKVETSQGRWRLLPIHEGPNNVTVRMTRLAQQFLDRYGIVTRELIQSEAFPGGYSALYPVLKAMEEAGKVRRGYFIEGHGASQFAWPGTEDRLRELSAAANDAEALSADETEMLRVVSAVDPANPFGNGLPWPSLEEDRDYRPARATGAFCCFDNGTLVAHLTKSAKQLALFVKLDDQASPLFLKRLAATLASLDLFRRDQAIQTINGVNWRESPWLLSLETAGFLRSRQGLFVRGF